MRKVFLGLLFCALYLPARAADVVINEFMAINNGAYTNHLGQKADWIELKNVTSSNISLTGWHLTDNADDLNQWTFPATNIGASAYLLIHADNSSTSIISGHLHANFKLDGAGEYLALVRPGGTSIAYEYGPVFPPQEANISYGICTNLFDGFGYFTNGTPGKENGPGFMGYLTDTKFEPNRGLYTNPIVVAITSLTVGAQIRITTNCELPSVTSSLYVAAIPLSNSTVFRAQAYNSGHIPSGVDNHTYIFLNDVLKQPALPAGFPTNWGATAADYAMDPIIVGDPVFGPMMTNAMKALPSVFLTTDKTNLFDAVTGIYVKSTEEGELWERPAHIAWVRTNNTTAFELNCGIRMQGGYFRDMGVSRKHSFRALFKGDYGPTKLDYDVYDDPTAVKSFDTLIFRAGANDAWNNWTGGGGSASRTYLVDEFARRSCLAMGQPSPHGTYAHLYLDGLYWGLYCVVEKPDQSFAEAYFGIDKTNCDVVASFEIAIEGSSAAWYSLLSMCNAGVSNNADYQKIQGCNPDGTRNPAYPDYLDIDNYIDYLMTRMWIGDMDWPVNNWICFRNRDGATSTGFKFGTWDAEAGMGVWGGLGTDKTGDGGGVCAPYTKLLENAEFRLLFADHIQRHMFNDGAMTTNQTIPRYKELAQIVEPAIVAESARWGDQSGGRYTLNHWRAQTNYVVTTFLPQRPAEMIQQFKNRGLYPSIDAPVFSRRGGIVSNGFQLVLSSANPVYYTLDGRDPREYGTSQPTGTLYSGAITLTESVLVRTRARSSGGVWSAIDEAYFVMNEPNPLRITELMYCPRVPTDTNLPTSEYEFIEFQNTGDHAIGLGGVKFKSGIHFDFTESAVLRLAPQEYVLIVKNLAAFKTHYSNWATMKIAGEFQRYCEFPIENLSDGGEKLILEDAFGTNIISFTYGDGRDWPLAADGAGHSLVPLTMTNQAGGSLDYGGNWRASAYIDGSPGAADPAPVRSVLINEVVAHTDVANQTGYDSNDKIELYNTTVSPVTMDYWYLSDDAENLKKWRIPTTNLIGAQGFLAFDEINGFHKPITNGFGLAKFGEDLFLSHLPGNTQDRVADCVRYKAQQNGLSWGRYSDGGLYWYELPITWGYANALPSNRVIISEIMYHPAPTPAHPEDNDEDEFIELFNPTAGNILLMGECGPDRISGGIEYSFPSNTVIPAGSYIVIVPFNPTNTAAVSAFCAAYSIPTNRQILLYGPYKGRLANNSERVALEKSLAADVPGDPAVSWVIIDEVIYHDQAPWPADADATGLAIRRTISAMNGNDSTLWLARAPTPGQADGAEDNDHDNMADAWEIQYFGGTNVADGGPTDDWDHDGMNNHAEYLCGTSPTNAASSLSFTTPGPNPAVADEYIVSWQSVSGKWYRLEAATNLVSGFNLVLGSNIPSAWPANNVYTGDVRGLGQRFYRVKLE